MTPLLLIGLLSLPQDLPPVPSSGSPEFKKSVYAVEHLLADGKFGEAAVLAAKLPRFEMTMQWDDTKVPEQFRTLYAASREAAVTEWQRIFPDLKVTVAKVGDIKVSFEQTLPAPADSVEPAGAVFFSSDAKSDPRIEAVIALKRGVPPAVIDPRHVQNEVGFAIGSFLGIARLPRAACFMGRYDGLLRLDLRASKYELEQAKATVALADALRKAAADKAKVEVKQPQMYMNPLKLSHEAVKNGKLVQMSLEVTNRGNAPLKLSTVVSCGCVSATAPAEVAPGATSLIDVKVDTSAIRGFLGKDFMVYSNDPDAPEKRVAIDLWVTPIYQFFRPNGNDVVAIPEEGYKEDMYITYDPDEPFTIKSATVQGLKGAIEVQEWTGELPDPALHEASKPRKGYKLSVLVSPTQKTGRIPFSVNLETTSTKVPVIVEAVAAQWGLAALPQRVYFGEVKPSGAVGYFTVSAASRKFSVKKVSTTSDRIRADAELLKNGDYQIMVTLVGPLPMGNLAGNVFVDTDDEKQPRLTVPVDAFVR